MEIRNVKVMKPDNVNIIMGQSHFIKTVEDIYETLVCSMPGIKFGVAFCESSGDCLIRTDGTDEEMKKIASENASAISAGHSFFIALGNAFPINVLRELRHVPEIVSFFCATANPVDVVIADENGRRGILGVIDGEKINGIETEEDVRKRKDFLRKIGYKR
jgi:adenosine/AMP kinase